MDIAVNNKDTVHFFFFKCYRFVIIDIKQYSNHSAYIHICTGEYKKKKCYSILLFKLFLLVKGIVQQNFLLITLSVEALGIAGNSFLLGNSENAARASVDAVVSSKWLEFTFFFSVSYPFNHGCSENGLFLFSITVILPTSTELSWAHTVRTKV